MSIDFQRVLPVIVSICIIIAVAVLRQYSKTLAAIAATMPINIPLGLWIVYAGEKGNNGAMVDFSRNVMVNMIPTMFFAVVVWFAFRAGWTLVPSIIAGYIAWAIVLGVISVIKV
jgi:hypothetical protein